MLVTIVLTFALCWLPLHLYMLLGNVARQVLVDNPSSTFPLFFTIHWLAMANSFINPIIYGFLNDGFRVRTIKLIWARIHKGGFLFYAFFLKPGV